MSLELKPLILGIDIGSTSVKTCILDAKQKIIIKRNNTQYEFVKKQDINPMPSNYCQQDVQTIFSSLDRCLTEIDLELRKKIGLISVCGQMHGCVLWNKNNLWKYNERKLNFSLNYSLISDLYNWQDMRCSSQFISTLPKPDSFIDYISSGFGCATIFWLQKNTKNHLNRYTNGGTIMDLLVTIICGLETPLMSDQNATSWGYFDPMTNCWNKKLLESNDFPTHLLPKVEKAGSTAGVTLFDWHGIDSNTPVMVALGDMQCSCFANLRDNQKSAVLNISTSMQLSFLTPNNFIPETKSESKNKSIDYFPYFENRYLSVAASLNGGNVLQTLIKSLRNITQQLTNIDVKEDDIWDKILQSYKKPNKQNLTKNNELSVKATLFGERHDTTQKASILNISDSLALNDIINGICIGLIDNIFEMMPIKYMIDSGVERIIGTGSALSRNAILRDVLDEKLNIPVIYVDGNDADVGSVWVAYHVFSDN